MIGKLDPKRFAVRVGLKLQSINLILAGIGALVLFGAFCWTVLIPAAQQRLLALQGENAAASAILTNQPTPAVASSALSVEGNLDRFNSLLGEPKHLEDHVATLFVIARDLGIELERGQYKLSCEDGSGFCRYRIQLPLKSGYRQTRLFTEQVLQAIPFASIDELVLRREAISDTDVDARLGLTLYIRSAPAAAPRKPRTES